MAGLRSQTKCAGKCHIKVSLLVGCTLAVGIGAIAQAAASDTMAHRAPREQAAGRGEGQESAAVDEELDDLDLLSLEVSQVQVVVTASRRAQKITSVPYAMNVITANDLRWSGARNVPDALRLAAGVDVAEVSYGNTAVSPRGLHSLVGDNTLVLVDGRQIYDAFFGRTTWGSFPFQLEDIDRIEVIRGPGGVTWGANAVNGVINIITKDPRDQLGLTVTAQGGSRGTHKEHLGYAWADETLRLRVSGEYEASDGFQKGIPVLPPYDDDYKSGRIGIHTVYDASPDDTITIAGGSDLVDGGFPPTFGAGSNPKHAGSEHHYLLGKWAHKVEPDNWFELTGYVNDFELRHPFPSVEYRYQQLVLQFSHTFSPNERHTITWGLDNRVELVDATNSDPFMLGKDYVASEVVGIYVQDEWRFAPRWTLNVGGRVDYDSYGGFQPSGRAAMSYELTESSSVYGAVSRAFHMPTAASRFTNVPLLEGIARVYAHEDLDAVTLVAYEIGYRAKWFDKLETNAALYWHEFDDIATFSPRLGPPALLTFDYDNRADASMYGVELDARYQVNDQLTLLANYTFERIDWRSHAALAHTDVMGPPEHKFMTGVRYSPTEDIHLSSHLYYVDTVEAPDSVIPFFTETIPAYFRWDLRAEYEFWDDRASIAVGVRNLLDRRHPEGTSNFFAGGEVPRMIYAEMRVSFE